MESAHAHARKRAAVRGERVALTPRARIPHPTPPRLFPSHVDCQGTEHGLRTRHGDREQSGRGRVRPRCTRGAHGEGGLACGQ